MSEHHRCYVIIISSMLVASKLANSIIIPLFLDSITPSSVSVFNITGTNFTSADNVPLQPGIPSWQRIDPLIQIAVAMTTDTIVMGFFLLAIMVFSSGRLSDRERDYPKRNFALIGVSMSLNALMFQYAAPGDRTPPYLQAFLFNFQVPVIFGLRFLILHKRPTMLKSVCASAIFLAGMVSLLPTFISGLETAEEHSREGGATGARRVIWPVIFMLSSVPRGLSNIILEKTVKFSKPSQETNILSQDQQPPTTYINQATPIHHEEYNEQHHHGNSASSSYNYHPVQIEGSNDEDENKVLEVSPPKEISEKPKLNMVYTLFWTFLFQTLGVYALFWMDFIPKFGMQSNVKLFLPQVLFNIKCILGLTDICEPVTIVLAWARNGFRFSTFVFSALLLRYSEGANFNSLVKTIHSPISLIFWSLFEEHPFHWDPQAELSTWLSLAAILVMVPAVIIYDRGAPEINVANRRCLDHSSTNIPSDHVEEEVEKTLLLK